MEREASRTSITMEPTQSLRESAGLESSLDAFSVLEPPVAPLPPPAPPRVSPTIYLDGLDPLFKDDGRGPSIGRRATFTLPKKGLDLEDLLGMVEHAAEIGRVAMAFHPLPPAQTGEPAVWTQFRTALARYADILAERKDVPTTGKWTARLHSEAEAWLPGNKVVCIDIHFEGQADWGDTGVDAALLRALPDLYAGLNLYEENRSVKEHDPLPFRHCQPSLAYDLPGGDKQVDEVRPLVWGVECRAAFYEDMGRGKPMESFMDRNAALLMTRAAFRKKHSDFKSGPGEAPKALAQDPETGGTTSYQVFFTDEYLAAEERAVSASLCGYMGAYGLDPTESQLRAASEAHRAAADEAHKLGLSVRVNRHNRIADEFEAWAGSLVPSGE